jgi:iron complex transport system ATP-binding protein
MTSAPNSNTAPPVPEVESPEHTVDPHFAPSLISAPEVKNAEHHFLEMRHVNVALGDRIVLHDINLSIRSGEHVAILGANGCGKSTLIRAMNCEIYPVISPDLPPPEIRIFGRARWDLTELRKHFGVVSESLTLNHNPRSESSTSGRPTGADAVIAGYFSASSLWPNLHVTPEMRLRAAEALARVHATYLANHRVSEMSAGEKRRILIARALVHRPRQLLLDEPSNALDLAAQRTLRETMRTLMRPAKSEPQAPAFEPTGLILVTHHLGDIPPEIDRVILMRAGRILNDGPRAEVLTAPILSELFGTEVRLGEHDGWLHSW